MKKIFLLTLSLLVALPAYGDVAVNGQLKSAQFEKLSSSPTGSEARVYYDTTEKKAKIYNGSAWQNVGSGSGSAGNLITNGDAEDAAVPSGWGVYDDGASAAAVDGTGGSPAGIYAIDRTTNASRVMTGAASWDLGKDLANGQGEGWAYSFTVPSSSGIRNALNEISFYYHMDVTTADVYRVYIYDVTNSVLITPSFTTCGGGSTPSLTSTTTTCAAKLSWVGTTGTSFRLLFHVANTTSSETHLYIDDLFVGQRGVQVGPGESEWVSYTPTVANNGSKTFSTTGRWRRVGDSMEVAFSLLGNTTASGSASANAVTMTLPSGYTIDKTKTASASYDTASNIYGKFFSYTNGTYAGGSVSDAASTTLEFILDTASRITTSSLNNTSAGEIYGFARVPISQWAGGVAYGENNVTYGSNSDSSNTASNTSSFAYGPAGSQFPNGAVGTDYVRRVDVGTIQATDQLTVEISDDSGATWSDIGSAYGNIASPFMLQGTSAYGVQLRSVSSTSVDVYFRAQGRFPNGATYGANGSPWSGVSSSQYKWRVKKSKAGVPVGFGLASSTTPGLVQPSYSTSQGTSTDVQLVRSGYWTPGGGGITNITGWSTGGRSAKWMQVGKIVTVSGSVSVQCTSGADADTAGYLTLPVNPASNFAGQEEATGTGVFVPTTPSTAYRPVNVVAYTSNKAVKLQWTCNSASASRELFYTYQYLLN